MKMMWLMAGLKVAVTLWLAFNVTLQVAVVPVQAPLQPANVEKVEAGPEVSVSVTAVLEGKFALHVPGQLIPDGELVTDPDALPLVVSVTVS